jgi:hypothetical protein
MHIERRPLLRAQVGVAGRPQWLNLKKILFVPSLRVAASLANS